MTLNSVVLFVAIVVSHASTTRLLPSEEAELRDAVYNGPVAIAFPTKGPFKYMDILCAPEAVMKYEKKKRAALLVLLDIVKGGAPKDAKLAAGFAHCLCADPGSGYLSVATPSDSFDKPLEGLDRSQRQFLVEIVKKRIDELK